MRRGGGSEFWGKGLGRGTGSGRGERLGLPRCGFWVVGEFG